ncbi:unknown [Methanoculleus sp. CAG:1088]|nr:unknown [Methanoculleus sp. CAG:1088]
MIGTSNDSEMLTDPTGNRRYFPFDVSPERSRVGFGPGGFRNKDAKHYIRQV